MFSGIPDSIKLKNADGTTGRESAGSLVCFSLANEDFGILTAINTQTGQFQFIGGRLKVDAQLDASSVTIGAVRIQDGVGGTLGTIKTSGLDFGLVVIQNNQPLPTGASTEATLALAKVDLDSILSGMSTAINQGTEIVHLTTIDTTIVALNAKFNSLGQKVMSASVPVALASDEVVPISAAILPLPTGASTSALQTALNTSAASIDSKTTAPGQALMAASSPVVIASDQSRIPAAIHGGNEPSYMACVNGFVQTALRTGSINSIGYLINPNTAKRIEITTIIISWDGQGGGSGGLTFRGAFITAENAVPGGTTPGTNPTDRSDPASVSVWRTGATGAPTYVVGDLLGYAVSITIADTGSIILFDAKANAGKGIILRAGQTEGFEIRTVISANLAAPVRACVSIYWREV